ncbi:recombinase family protein [Kribbella sp. NPDC051587]|uniref:recombinase family protein n=1 Tax=Kribbella sp. NPDC051587 TaxID=3364119 RepID=UPI0037A1BCF9
MTQKRRVYADKMALMSGGAQVVALIYARASQDQKRLEKSVDDQLDLGRGEVVRHGWTVGKTFKDNNISASRYAKKKTRAEYELLLDAIRSGDGDVLILFELARSHRDLKVYVELRELCINVGLWFWLIGGQLYDLRVRADLMSLGFQAVQAEDQSVGTHENVLRGINGAALRGLPHGKLNFGYRRIYDEKTRAFVAQVPDDEFFEGTPGPDGEIRLYQRSEIVREVFRRLDGGATILAIEQDFLERGIVTAKGNPVNRATIRKWALNPVYIGKRVLHGEIVGEGLWDGLISDELYWSVNVILKDEKRMKTRAGAAKYIASYIGKCECGSVVQVTPPTESWYAEHMYRCYLKNCWRVPMTELDSLLLSTIIAWCSRPDVEELLTAAYTANDEALSEARADAKRIESEWEEWLRGATVQKLKPTVVARFEAQFESELQHARDRAKELSLPSVLRDTIGPDAERKIKSADIAVKRELLRILGPFEVSRGAGKKGVPLDECITWHGLLGSELNSSSTKE